MVKRKSEATGWVDITGLSPEWIDWFMAQPDQVLLIKNDKILAEKLSGIYYRKRLSPTKVRVFFNQKLKK